MTIVPERAIVPFQNPNFRVYNYGPTPDCWEVNAVYKESVYLGEAERGLIETMQRVFEVERKRNPHERMSDQPL